MTTKYTYGATYNTLNTGSSIWEALIDELEIFQPLFI